MEALIFSVYFQIGVNIIGLPEILEHKVRVWTNEKIISV